MLQKVALSGVNASSGISKRQWLTLLCYIYMNRYNYKGVLITPISLAPGRRNLEAPA